MFEAKRGKRRRESKGGQIFVVRAGLGTMAGALGFTAGPWEVMLGVWGVIWKASGWHFGGRGILLGAFWASRVLLGRLWGS